MTDKTDRKEREALRSIGEEQAFEAWFKVDCPVEGANAKIAAKAAWKARASLAVSAGSGPLMGQPQAMPDLSQLKAMCECKWMDIETAPKDGQAILVTDGMDCYCVEWDEEFDWWTVDDNKLGPFRLRGSAPTHWMPTPAAPGSAGGESNE